MALDTCTYFREILRVLKEAEYRTNLINIAPPDQ